MLIAAALAGGPVAEARWEEYAEAVSEALVAEPMSLGRADRLRLEIRHEPGIARAVASGSLGRSLSAIGVQVRFRIERREGDTAPRAATGLKIEAARLCVEAGARRGGLASGLLVRDRYDWAPEPAATSAWGGLPPRPAVTAASPYYPDPTSIVVTGSGRSTWALLLAEDRNGRRIGAAGLRVTNTLRLAALAGRSCRGLEVTLGESSGNTVWRLAIAAWQARGKSGSAGELLVSGRQTMLRWSARIWHAAGDSSPLATRLRGATNRYTSGCHLGGRIQPDSRTGLGVSLEYRKGGEGPTRSIWWRERLELNRGSGTSAGLDVRWRRTTEVQSPTWIGPVERVVRHLEIRAHTSNRAPLQWRAAVKRRADGDGGVSRGAWVQCGWTFPGRLFYLRAVRSHASAGPAIYWHEPGPAGSWRMRAVRQTEARFLIGVSDRPERWHGQLVVTPDGRVGVRAGWRLGFRRGQSR
jgi:hypothetical protein